MLSISVKPNMLSIFILSVAALAKFYNIGPRDLQNPAGIGVKNYFISSLTFQVQKENVRKW
jgi:hypothetical protein